VPEVLLSGNHALIDQWRREQSQKRTLERRPDCFNKVIDLVHVNIVIYFLDLSVIIET